MRNKYSVYVDGSYKESRAGIGIVVKKNHSVVRQKRYRVTNCQTSQQAEKIAIHIGVEALLKIGSSPKRSVVYTDCLGVVKELNGELQGIPVVWVPRESNEAHGMSVIGRTMTWHSCKKYKNFQKVNADDYV